MKNDFCELLDLDHPAFPKIRIPDQIEFPPEPNDSDNYKVDSEASYFDHPVRKARLSR